MRKLVEQRIDGEGGRNGDAPRGRGRSVTVNLSESPLSWLRARGRIDARQFEAGEYLRADYERAALPPRTTMRWEPGPGRGRHGPPDHADPTTAQIAARQRFDAAMAAAGPGLSDILWRVVCACDALADAERSLGWPSRAGKLVLAMALDRVADAYRLT